ncbi:MAG TPA: hypothetical protein VGO93_01560 [Candidatus Xenobia bacterium]
MNKNPLDILVGRQRRRPLMPLYATAGLLFCLGLPEYTVLRYQQAPQPMFATATTLAGVLMVLLPCMAAGTVTGVLDRMRRARFLTDLQLTLIPPERVCDHLVGRAIWPGLLGGGLFAVVLSGVPGFDGVALPWYGFLVLASLAVCYLGSVYALWRTADGVPWWDRVLMAGLILLAFSPTAGLLASSEQSEHATAWLLSCMGVSLLVLIALSRRMAVLYLTHGSAWTAAVRHFGQWFRPASPNPWLRPRTTNPMVFRIRAAVASKVPGGLLGAALYWGDSLFLAVLLTLGLPREVGVVMAVEALVGMYWLRLVWSAWRTVSRDRDHLELLSTTTMTPAEYVDGMARGVALPRLLFTLIGLVVIAILKPGQTMSFMTIPGVLWTLVGTPLLVYATLYVSVQSRNLLEVGFRLWLAAVGCEIAVALPAVLVGAGVYAVLGPGAGMIEVAGGAVTAVLAYAGLVHLCRQWAINKVGGPLQV